MDVRCDIYSLGATLYMMVTGQLPFKSSGPLDAWMKKHARIGLSGVDTRALTRRIRTGGAPNGVIAHSRSGQFDIPMLLQMARKWPGLEGMDLAISVSCETHYGWEGGVWRLGFGYGDSAFPSRSREGLGEGSASSESTEPAASPSPDPSRKREGSCWAQLHPPHAHHRRLRRHFGGCARMSTSWSEKLFGGFRRTSDKLITVHDWTSATVCCLGEATLASWDNTFFTLNWTMTTGTQYIIHYIVIGGSTVSAKLVPWTMPTSTASNTVLAAGFQPDVVIHANGGDTNTAAVCATTACASSVNAAFGLGVMDSAGNQWAFGTYSVDGSAAMDTQRAQRLRAL